MRHDDTYRARVEKAEGRKARLQEEVEASRRVKGSSVVDPPATSFDSAPAVGDVVGVGNCVGPDGVSEGALADQCSDPKGGEEEETDVAVHSGSTKAFDFQAFLNNMQGSFAQAVEESNEVSEVYSVPRVTKVADRMGLKLGWALDICTDDENGTPWDFTKVEMKNKAVRK